MARRKPIPEPIETPPLPTLSDIAKLLGCDQRDVKTRVDSMTVTRDMLPDGPGNEPHQVPRPHPLRWNRKALNPSSKINAVQASKRKNGPEGEQLRAVRVKQQERRNLAWQLACQNFPPSIIAQRLNISVYQVQADLKWWFESLVPPNIEEVRALQLQGTQQLAASFYGEALNSKNSLGQRCQAADTWLRIMKRFDALCHLDRVAPINLNVTLPTPQGWQALIDGVIADVPSTVVEPASRELVAGQ